MLDLRIDNKLAVVSQSVSFTLNRENPLFTDSEDSTYEVTLPLLGCEENQRIFGPINRSEYSKVSLVGKKYPFTLLADNIRIEGDAVVTSVADSDIKVQLLAGVSVFNNSQFVELGKDKYLDELDLGKAKTGSFTYGADAYDWRQDLQNYLHTLTRDKDYEKAVFLRVDNKMPFEDELFSDCVYFPIMSQDGKIANKRNLYDTYHWDRGALAFDSSQYLLNRPKEDAASADSYVAPQPYFIRIVEKVIAALGYNLVHNDIDFTWMRNIFIANCINEVEFRKMLPHWTVSEFFDEVRKFFGVTIRVKGKEVSIVRNQSFYKNCKTVTLVDVVDEYTVNIEEDPDEQDVSTANVDYDYADIDPILRLPDEVWENAKISEFENEEKLGDFVQNTVDKEEGRREASLDLMVVKHPSAVKAFLMNADTNEFDLADVDMCPPLIRDSRSDKGDRDIKVKMRIVPAMIQKDAIDLHNLVSDGGGGYVEQETKINHIAIPILVSNAPSESSYTKFSVNNAINENKNEENKEGNSFDNIIVALNYGDNWRGEYIDKNKMGRNYDFPMAFGIGWVKGNGGLYNYLACANNHHQFQLNNKTAPSIYDTVLSTNYHIDRRCVHIFSFMDNVEIAPDMIFMIKNRRYVCEKLEYTIDEKGVKPLKKGYFYEFN